MEVRFVYLGDTHRGADQDLPTGEDMHHLQGPSGAQLPYLLQTSCGSGNYFERMGGGVNLCWPTGLLEQKRLTIPMSMPMLVLAKKCLFLF